MAKNKVAAGKIQKKPVAPIIKPTASAIAAATKPTKSKQLSEIDDIFAKPKQPKEQPTTPVDTVILTATKSKLSSKSSVKVIDATFTDKIANPKKQMPPPKDDDPAFADSKGKNSKYTDDGLRVFYMEDLRIGEGEGDTE
ncbi:hypothetical protein GGF37_004963, partial [Kickxella alabastrina]